MAIELKAKINNKWVVIATSGESNSTKKYTDSINKPFDFQGKKIGWYGDSIVAGVKSGTDEGEGFIKIFSDRVGATFSNNGVSGSTATAPNGSLTSSTLCYKLNSGAKADEDVVIIAIGTNDYAHSRALGSYGSTDNADFYGAINYVCDKLKTNNPDTPVIWITPINKYNYVSSNPATLDDYRNAIFEVATTYGHSVVDGSSLGLPSVRGSAGSWEYFMNADGVHPTAEGHKLYARSLCGKLL
jgi:lysophospholipase L1-like esterase